MFQLGGNHATQKGDPTNDTGADVVVSLDASSRQYNAFRDPRGTLELLWCGCGEYGVRMKRVEGGGWCVVTEGEKE